MATVGIYRQLPSGKRIYKYMTDNEGDYYVLRTATAEIDLSKEEYEALRTIVEKARRLA